MNLSKYITAKMHLLLAFLKRNRFSTVSTVRNSINVLVAGALIFANIPMSTAAIGRDLEADNEDLSISNPQTFEGKLQSETLWDEEHWQGQTVNRSRLSNEDTQSAIENLRHDTEVVLAKERRSQPNSLARSASESGSEDTLLQCVYSGGSFNECDSTPQKEITGVVSIPDGNAYNGLFPLQKVKIICDGWGCTQQAPVYYNILCLTNWGISPISPLSMEAGINVYKGTSTLISDTRVPCGSGTEGSCVFDIAGVIDPTLFSTNPDDDVHMSAKAFLSPVSALMGWNYTCSFRWSLESPEAERNERTTMAGQPSACSDPRTCPPISSEEVAQHFVGDPINTYSGRFSYNISDLEIETLAGPLVFERTYSSLASDYYTATLGIGWTHNHDIRLLFPDDPMGEPGVVWFKGPHANQYKFLNDPGFTPASGVLADLEAWPDGSYVITTTDQSIYTFNSDGLIVTWENPQKHRFFYTYDSVLTDRLERITDSSGQRYLQLNYDPSNPYRLTSVVDHTNREVFFSYSASNELLTATDVLGRTWYFSYTDSQGTPPHLLTEIRVDETFQPGVQRIIVHTDYDQEGRAIRQYEGGVGQEYLTLELSYPITGTTIVTDALQGTHTYHFDSRGILFGEEAPDGAITMKVNGNHYRPSLSFDGLGNKTELAWSEAGTNLTQIDAADGSQTFLGYDLLNNLTTVQDARGFITTHSYSGTLLTSTTDALSNTTVYTYTAESDHPQPKGLLKEVRDPLGNITRYAYDAFGQLVQTTNAANQITSYTYDDLGRLKTETYQNKTNWTCYDHAGRIVKTVINASGNGATPETDPCSSSYQVDPDPLKDRISKTFYDETGSVIASIDPSGRIDRQYYDRVGRLAYSVRNLSSDWDVSNPNPPLHLIRLSQNLTTQYQYDLNGNNIATIEWTLLDSQVISTTTRTYYDPMGRPEYVVQNLSGWSLDEPLPPPVELRTNVANVTTRTYYDRAGNAIATEDPLGIITRTYYDNNNRPFLVVENVNPGAIETETLPACSRDEGATTNICTESIYDANGNIIATIAPSGRITRTYYDEVNRPYVVVENFVSSSIYDPAPVYNPSLPDQNIRTDTIYDANGNAIATIDPAGRITRMYYDEIGRIVTRIQNLDPQNLYDATPPAYDPSTPDRNVRTDTVYDDLGNAIAVIDWWDDHGQVISSTTRTYFDELNRPITVVQNLDPDWNIFLPSSPACNRDETGLGGTDNLCTETRYDADGNSIARIDPLGKISRTYYDELKRPVAWVENLVGDLHSDQWPAYDPSTPDQNIRSETIYDGRGRRIADRMVLTESQKVTTRTYYDALGRAIGVVENFTGNVYDEQWLPFDPNDPDQNVRSEMVYDANGNQIATASVITEGNKQWTRTYFDPLGRVQAVVENWVGSNLFDAQWPIFDPNLPDQNLRTEYRYDPSGNRVAKTDGNGTVTRYEYNGMNQLSAVTENYRVDTPPNHEMNVRTEYRYDASGNRTAIRNANSVINGTSDLTQFNYDGMGRLASESDPLGNTTVYTYNAAGWKTSQKDANGNFTYFDYNLLGMLTGIDYPEPDVDVAFRYDVMGNQIYMQDEVGETTWFYDDLGRTLSVTDPYTGTVQYQYDAAGNRIRMVYPDSRAVNYHYDALGRMTGVEDWNLDSTTYTYDAAGRLVTTSRPNGVVSTHFYDGAGRLEKLIHSTAANTLATYEYSYDPVGNRTRVVETLAGVDGSYVDDLLFSDSFESGDLWVWSEQLTDSGDLSVDPVAAIDGAFGMQAILDDNQKIYVTSRLLEEQTRYRARFHFDPNSVTMNQGDIFSLLAGYDLNNQLQLMLELRAAAGDYQIRPGIVLDNKASIWAGWTTVLDGPHAFEIDWRAASATGANDGGMSLWMDGVEIASLSGIDNDIRRVQYVTLGAWNIDNGTRGTVYFDAFESRQESYIGPAAGALEPPEPPARPDAIFADGFEAGDLSAWSLTQTDGGDLSVSVQAVLTGTYGLQAVLDDYAAIYTTDWSPLDETRYRARFHFDPNGITMNHGEVFSLLTGYDHDNQQQLMLEFRFTAGDYQIRPGIVLDNKNWIWAGWTTVLDGPHAFEIDWRAASATGANDGGMALWMDGIEIASLSGIDNDIRRVQYVTLGAWNIDAGTRGTLFFDAFESRRETYIGAAAGALEPPEPPARPDAIFADGFEAGNLSAWSLAQTDGGDLGVSTQAVLTGAYGLQAVLDDNYWLYVADWNPVDETRYRARFHFDPNSITMADLNAFFLMLGYDRDNNYQFMIEFRYASGAYQIRPGIVLDNKNWVWAGWTTVLDGPHALEIDWRAASAPGANDGGMTLWMDGVEIASLSGIDNDTRRIEYIALGARDVDSGTRGTLYFDAFESRRETYIGLAAGVESSLGAWAPAPRQATLKVKAAMINNIDGEPDVVQRPVKAEPAQSKTQPAAWLLELWEPTGNEGLKNEGLNFVPQTVEMSMVAGDPCAIYYEYDPLGRLTGARYSDGRYFRYAYDAAGNQLTSESRAGKTVYSYDAANRLASVDGVTQTWDANGNLLSDGANTYTFDHANRLKAVTGLEDTVTYRYNALGDRLETRVNGITTTHYSLDLAAGLTQVLDDGTHTYLYGNGRIAQHGSSSSEYFLGDALGSVRQLVDGAGTVVLAQSYTPYGETLSRSGTGETAFAFTGEAVDAYTGLVYLRARWYAPQSGRFMSRDLWQGDYYQPISYNAWLYGNANPIRYLDPTGHFSDEDYGIEFLGSWTSEHKDNVKAAVKAVAWKFNAVLDGSKNRIPTIMRFPSEQDDPMYNFSRVYGLWKDGPFKFDWDPNCYRCRPNECMAVNNIGGKKGEGKEYWENIVDIPIKKGVVKEKCECKPSGGYTMSSNWVKFASMWANNYPDERRVNNVVHELGHAFSARLDQVPANTVNVYSPPLVDNEAWLFRQKPDGFFKADSGNMTWMQSPIPSGSETFADMFLGWVFDKWAKNEYGEARADFMNQHMGAWIRKAMSRP